MTTHSLPKMHRMTMGSARESRHEQHADLQPQAMLLSEFYTKNSWTDELMRD